MNYKTINIVGTGYSGASAIYEFLQKTELFHDPFPNSQFSISYDPGGLLDLENVIINQFTINKSTLAYDKFVKLIKFYCDQNRRFKIGKNLVKHNKHLDSLLKNFLNNILILEYNGETAFTNFNSSFYESFKHKISNYLHKFKKGKRKNRKKLFMFCDSEIFEKEVKKLFSELFEKNNQKKKDIILEQAGTIFHPKSSLKYFNNPYSLCVLRDPRDIYTELKRKNYKFPGYSVEIFCSWYANIQKKINLSEKLDQKVFFLNFEDFVIKKTETINKIFDHIGYDRLEINKVDFNFNRCENNINLFKKELRNDEIVYIEKKLKKYLYPF
tara:strand:- start:11333 stop:12313 length:981 start_codon:yes stop_codon:yes gene_type:complete